VEAEGKRNHKGVFKVVRMEQTVKKEPYQKGNVDIMISLKNLDWNDLVLLVKYLQGNPLSAVVEVHIGNEVFDA
jgi:hypothetical protein